MRTVVLLVIGLVVAAMHLSCGESPNEGEATPVAPAPSPDDPPPPGSDPEEPRFFTVDGAGWVEDSTGRHLVGVDWAEVEPPAFLALLEVSPSSHVNVSATPPTGWIGEAHLPALVERIRDETPASPVVSVLSSYVPFGRRSTVGREAMFLIQGYREARYPPRLCSLHYFDPDPAEVEAWWRARGDADAPR